MGSTGQEEADGGLYFAAAERVLLVVMRETRRLAGRQGGFTLKIFKTSAIFDQIRIGLQLYTISIHFSAFGAYPQNPPL